VPGYHRNGSNAPLNRVVQKLQKKGDQQMSFSGIKAVPCGYSQLSVGTGVFVLSSGTTIPGVAMSNGAITANAMTFRTNEERRITAIREIFQTYEKDDAVKAAVNNVLEFFQWCRNVRNQLLHSTNYAPGLGSDPEMLYLMKRESKQSLQFGYIKLSVSELRSIDEQFYAGIRQSIKILFYLRFCGVPASSVEPHYRPFVNQPLPEVLKIPPNFKLESDPNNI
jgi:hypothetical protein